MLHRYHYKPINFTEITIDSSDQRKLLADVEKTPTVSANENILQYTLASNAQLFVGSGYNEPIITHIKGISVLICDYNEHGWWYVKVLALNGQQTRLAHLCGFIRSQAINLKKTARMTKV